MEGGLPEETIQYFPLAANSGGTGGTGWGVRSKEVPGDLGDGGGRCQEVIGRWQE